MPHFVLVSVFQRLVVQTIKKHELDAVFVGEGHRGSECVERSEESCVYLHSALFPTLSSKGTRSPISFYVVMEPKIFWYHHNANPCSFSGQQHAEVILIYKVFPDGSIGCFVYGEILGGVGGNMSAIALPCHVLP